MAKKLHAAAAWLSVALGAVHVLYTSALYDRLTLGAFWFAGSGFAIMFAGFVNLMLNRGLPGDAVSRWLCHAANAVCVALFGVGVYLIGEPQVYLGLLLFVCQAVTAVLLARPAGAARG